MSEYEMEQAVVFYRQQSASYRRIRNAVERQIEIMRTAPDPAAVLEISRSIEKIIEEIMEADRRAEPIKNKIKASSEITSPELKLLLRAIQKDIEMTTAFQDELHRALADYIENYHGGASNAAASKKMLKTYRSQ